MKTRATVITYYYSIVRYFFLLSIASKHRINLHRITHNLYNFFLIHCCFGLFGIQSSRMELSWHVDYSLLCVANQIIKYFLCGILIVNGSIEFHSHPHRHYIYNDGSFNVRIGMCVGFLRRKPAIKQTPNKQKMEKGNEFLFFLLNQTEKVP